MKSLSTINLGIAKKLRDKGYRHRFFRRRAQGEIATQIRNLRSKRKVTQAFLAKAMKTGQSAVARIEDAHYSGWSFPTLLKVAETLDARLRITFEPMEEVIAEYERQERRDAKTGFMGAEAGSMPQQPRLFQDITNIWYELTEEQLLLKSLGVVPAHESITLGERGAFIASKASQARTRAGANIFGSQSDETETNPAFASR